MRPLSRTIAAVAAGLAATLVAALVAAPASAVPTTTLNPAKLPRGADVAIPHLEKKTVVDGSVRISVQAPLVRLLGKSGTGYVVGTAKGDGTGGRFYRYEANGTSVPLMRANIYMSRLSGDGQTVVSVRIPAQRKSIVSAWSATTGDLVAQHTFRDYVDVSDAEGTKVLLGGWKIGTRLWDTSSDAVALVTKRITSAADLSADVLASYTGDPYDRGCIVVSSISHPGKRLWKSCDERVEAFNSDGTRMATVDILSDGIGPSWVGARTITGQKVGAYRVRDGWFGEIGFETTTALLLRTNGPRKAATVRCTGTTCERASDLQSTQTPRMG
jgi:hypothetical protein